MSTHLDRKALKRPDAFLERASGVVEYVTENTAVVVAVVAVLFLLGLGYAYYQHYATEKAQAADSALFDAHRALDEALAKAKGADWTAAAKPAFDQIEKVIKDFSGTRAAFEADLLVGDTYFKHNDWAKAAEWYKKGVENARPRSSRPAALYALAFANENLKNYDGAIEALHQVIASGSAAYKADAMMSLGRNFALKGDKAKALEAYGQVSKDYPNSALARQAELESAQLK